MTEHRNLSDELRAAESRIADHPGYKEHLRCEALTRSLAAVFMPNLSELLGLLDEAATNERLAIELVQNVREPVVAEQFQAVLTQRLHNYLASNNSLVDHVRRIMRGRAGSVAEEFERRKTELVRQPEVPFIWDLRNYALHRALPVLGHRVSISNLASTQKFESDVELSVGTLLEWKKWSPPARKFLECQGDGLRLRPTVRKHGQLIYELHAWLINELSAANEPALAEVNQLVLERNAVLMGGDLEAADRMSRWPRVPEI